MTSKILAASLFVLVAAPAVLAQSDRIHKVDGSVVEGIDVKSYDVRTVQYKKGSSSESLPSDQVAKLELGKFKGVYARGLSDPGLMLTLAREQKDAKNDVMAQLGYVHASRGFFDSGEPAKAVDALAELEKAYPEGGVLPELYRQKFDYYIGLGSKQLSDAAAIAKKYESAAIGNAWPSGFAIEAAFFKALCETDPAEFQKNLRTVIGRARAVNPVIASRANVELAHSLRKTDKTEEAVRLYETVLGQDKVDESARAGAYLGLGLVALDKSGSDKDKAKEAMLNFLRVRLETKDAWPGLQAEALYHTIQAARKWQGPEYGLIIGTCRRDLLGEYPNSEWAKLLRSQG